MRKVHNVTTMFVIMAMVPVHQVSAARGYECRLINMSIYVLMALSLHFLSEGLRILQNFPSAPTLRMIMESHCPRIRSGYSASMLLVTCGWTVHAACWALVLQLLPSVAP